MDDPEKMMQNCVLNVCQPGSSLLASGYCLYSSSTVMVLTIGHGVWGFTYDSQIGEFVLSHPDMKARPPASLLSRFTPDSRRGSPILVESGRYGQSLWDNVKRWVLL